MQRLVEQAEATGIAAGTAAAPRARGRSLSVVVPLLNEERGLPVLIERLTAALEGLARPWEVVIVDDGSSDGTLGIVRDANRRDPRIKAIALSRNFGKEVAVAAGLRHCGGDGVVVMDGDLQHPPEVVADLVARWEEGFDVVFAQRRTRDTDSRLHRLFAGAFYRLFERLSGTELPHGAGDFRLLDRKAVDAFNSLGERARFNKGLFAWIGFRSTGVPYDVAPRLEGETRWRPRRLFRFALDGLASFTTLPLRVWSYIGLLVSAFALTYSIVFLAKTLFWGVDVPGFPTLVISVMLLGGIQLISLGIIGEYLGRIYEEVKGRPLFVVGERVGIEAPPRAAERAGIGKAA